MKDGLHKMETAFGGDARKRRSRRVEEELLSYDGTPYPRSKAGFLDCARHTTGGLLGMTAEMR